jgi:hypothetical protein
LAALAAALSLAAPRAAAQPDAPVDPKLYALLVFDTDSVPRLPLEGNKKVLTRVLDQGFDRKPNNYHVRVLDGEKVTGEAILGHLRGLKGQVTTADTVLVYYAGHGATLEGKGHHLTLHHDANAGRPDLARQALLDEMKRLNARQVVVLTDCCSVLVARARGTEAPLPEASWPVLDCLFFHHQGVTDINACQANAFSWYHDDGKQAGGLFTLALGPLLCTRKEDFGKTFGATDGFVTWEQFAGPLQEGTNTRYRAMRDGFLKLAREGLDGTEQQVQDQMRKQERQLPQVFSLARRAPQKTVARAWLFGAELGTATLQSGKTFAVVGKVIARTSTGEETPAARAGVRERDLILSVNGVATPTDLDAAREIDQSAGKVTLKLRRGDVDRDVAVELLPVKKKPD